MSRRLIGTTAVGVAIAVAVAAGAPRSAWSATQMIVNNDTQAASLKGETWEHFKQLVEDELGDEVTVELHHGGALYSQDTQLQALQLGAIQGIAPVVGIYTGTFPKLGVLTLPYLLPTPEAIRAAVDDPAVQDGLLAELEAQGILPVAIWLNGPRNVGRRGEPILTPEEAQGVKIRVPGGVNYVEGWKDLGANVITMAWGEVPSALQQGVIDAVEPTPNAWLSSRLYEIADQITQNGYIYDFYIVAVNKPWFEGLDDQTRGKLEELFDRTTAWNWENAERANEEANRQMEEEGATVHALTPEQKAQWVDAMLPVSKRLGATLVDEELLNKLVEIGERNG